MDTTISEEFDTIRVLCTGCGWCRIVGYSGAKGSVRALIHLTRANNPCNVLQARVLELPAIFPAEILVDDLSSYRDLQHLAHAKGLIGAHAEFHHLLRDQPCPRCKQPGHLALDQYIGWGGDPRLQTHRSWRVIRCSNF